MGNRWGGFTSLLGRGRLFDVPDTYLPSASTQERFDYPLKAYYGTHLVWEWQSGHLASALFLGIQEACNFGTQAFH